MFSVFKFVAATDYSVYYVLLYFPTVASYIWVNRMMQIVSFKCWYAHNKRIVVWKSNRGMKFRLLLCIFETLFTSNLVN